MRFSNKIIIYILILITLAILSFLFYKLLNPKKISYVKPVVSNTEISLPTSVKPSKTYKLILVGDSMTQTLGDASDLKKDLKKNFPNNDFQIDNYGYGSTNILSIPDRLNKQTEFLGTKYSPILSSPFDIILIESMGANPLSEYPLEEGLKKQTETLDKIVSDINKTHPSSVIVFVATIAPSKLKFGEGAVSLLPEQKEKWVAERISYTKNHIKYAEDHKIPLIDIFHPSLTSENDGNIDYLSSADFIHPSPTGILFISKSIADYLLNSKIIP